MKNLFPKSVVKSMRYVHRAGTIDILKMQVEEFKDKRILTVKIEILEKQEIEED